MGFYRHTFLLTRHHHYGSRQDFPNHTPETSSKKKPTLKKKKNHVSFLVVLMWTPSGECPELGLLVSSEADSGAVVD